MGNEVCENCGRVIGKLEQAFLYKDHIVCKQCNQYLCDEPQKISSAPAKDKPSNVVRVIGVLSIAVIIVIFLIIFIVGGKISGFISGSPLRGMTSGEVQQLVRDWRAGTLPGMDLATKEQRDRLAEAESKLKDITKREYEPWNAKQPAPARDSFFVVTDKGAIPYAEELIKYGVASDSLVAQLELVKKLEEEIPAGPSLEAWQKNESKANRLTSRRGYFCPVQRGIDRSRAMFYKIFGKPDKEQLIPGEYRFYYRCRGGEARLTLPQHCFDRDCVSIHPYIKVF